MSDKIVVDRKVHCSVVNKEVYQELTYAKIRTLGSFISGKKLMGTFCMGFPKCNSQDCQLVIGFNGKNYSEEIED